MGPLQLLKMHLEELLPRLEMDMQGIDENLVVIFIDPISRTQNDKLRDAYFAICQENNMIDNYSHVKDSLNFEDSMHSVGVQIADFVTGCSSSFFKSQIRPGFERGEKMFLENVMPFLRRSGAEILGYGIREVPRNDPFRERIKRYISKQ